MSDSNSQPSSQAFLHYSKIIDHINDGGVLSIMLYTHDDPVITDEKVIADIKEVLVRAAIDALNDERR